MDTSSGFLCRPHRLADPGKMRPAMLSRRHVGEHILPGKIVLVHDAVEHENILNHSLLPFLRLLRERLAEACSWGAKFIFR